MPFVENTFGNVQVVGYTCHDPEDWAMLMHKLPQMNEIEAECQAEEKLEEDDVMYTTVTDFLSRPALYKECSVALVEHLGDTYTRRVEAIAVFAMKPLWLNGQHVKAAFGFLTRTRPSFRRKGAIKMFFSLLPRTFEIFNVGTAYGYIHKGNTNSLNMNAHTPIFGEHLMYVVKSPKVLNDQVPLERMSSDEANSLYQAMHGKNDFAWKNYYDILEHPNHMGTFTVQTEIGTCGLSLWDMSKLGRLAIAGQKKNSPGFAYNMVHNVFFVASDKFTNSDEHAKLQFELMERLIEGVQHYNAEVLGIHHLIFDIDQTLAEWSELLERNFCVIGKTEEYLSGFGINATERGKHVDVKRFLDPRDFSTLLFFKEGNTPVHEEETVQVEEAATEVPEKVLSSLDQAIAPRLSNDLKATTQSGVKFMFSKM